MGVIQANMTPEQRQEQYDADVTYGTNSEFGFDYLRDNMTMRREHMVQRGHSLLHRGRGGLHPHRRGAHAAHHQRRAGDGRGHVPPVRARRAAPHAGDDYEVDEKQRTIAVTEERRGQGRAAMDIDNLYKDSNGALVNHLNQALRAEALYHKDVEYVVQNGEVLIVDEFTGRILDGPALLRGPAPGHRGQGERADPRREPDPRHHHPAELLPHVRGAGGHDRHGQDRGGRVPRRSTSSRWCRSPPTRPWCARTRTTSSS